MSASLEDQLIEDIAAFTHDPLGFVMYAYPWGEEGSELENKAGPEPWQVQTLTQIGNALQANAHLKGTEALELAVQIAIASGHGVGKSCMLAWIKHWAMSTFRDCRGVVTANTETQLKTKTWPEMAKWYRLLICRHWFVFTATALYSSDPEHEKTWRFDMVPWSEKNTEAFAGLHNQGKRIIVIFDEGSKIPNLIWETTEGALTDADTEIIWVVCGNPTQNTGRFRECFEQFKHRWWTMQVDSRDITFTNKGQIAKWIEDYGDDSDFVRVRIKGQFPRAGAQQLIGIDIIENSFTCEATCTLYDPLVIGVDVARFGDDQSVIVIRKGRDARTHAPIKMRGADTMTLAARVQEVYTYYKADAVFVDGGGVGGGVVDRLRQLKVPVIEVNFGGKPDHTSIDEEHEKAYNKRAEMWLNMRKWLKANGALPRDIDYRQGLVQQTYEFRTIRGGDAIILTSKEAMKADGLESPDVVDALACTFAYPVQIDPRKFGGYEGARQANFVKHEYDPIFGEAA